MVFQEKQEKKKRGRPKKGEERYQPVTRIEHHAAGQKLEMKEESKRRRLLNIEYPEAVRYKERSGVERVNGRMKDEFGARHVRVRGSVKVMAHLMFGILVLTADQLLRMIC